VPLTLTDAGRSSPIAALEDVAVLHRHGDQFDIPAGAVHLAATAIGTNQAFALGSQVLGVQFHLVADPTRIERWLVGHASELQQVGIDPRTLRAKAREAQPYLTNAAQRVISRWLESCLLHQL